MVDLISRQAALDAIKRRLTEPAYQHAGEDWYVGMNDAESELLELPSAQPERKTGRWIERWHENKHVIGDMACSVCGAQMLLTFPRFCPHCGAEMNEIT